MSASRGLEVQHRADRGADLARLLYRRSTGIVPGAERCLQRRPLHRPQLPDHRAEQRLEQLGQRGEGHPRLGIHRPTTKHGTPVGACVPHDLADHGGLADPRRPLHDHCSRTVTQARERAPRPPANLDVSSDRRSHRTTAPTARRSRGDGGPLQHSVAAIGDAR